METYFQSGILHSNKLCFRCACSLETQTVHKTLWNAQDDESQRTFSLLVCLLSPLNTGQKNTSVNGKEYNRYSFLCQMTLQEARVFIGSSSDWQWYQHEIWMDTHIFSLFLCYNTHWSSGRLKNLHTCANLGVKMVTEELNIRAHSKYILNVEV